MLVFSNSSIFPDCFQFHCNFLGSSYYCLMCSDVWTNNTRNAEIKGDQIEVFKILNGYENIVFKILNGYENIDSNIFRN